MSSSNNEKLFKISFTVDPFEARAFGEAHKKFVDPAYEPKMRRTADELINEGQKTVEAAMEGAIFSWGKDPSLIAPEKTYEAVGTVADIEEADLKKRIVGCLAKHVGKSFVTYLGSRGPFNSNRFWLRIGDTKFGDIPGYATGDERVVLVVAFPELVNNGNHGAILCAFANSISNYLDAGGPSTICDFVEKSGRKFGPGSRRFAFPKAMHTTGFPNEELEDFKHDIDLIFRVMKDAKGKGNLSGLLFLTRNHEDEA